MPTVSDEILCSVARQANSMFAAAKELEIPFSTFIRRAKRLGVYVPNQHEIGVYRGGVTITPLKDILVGKHPKYKTYDLKLRMFKEQVMEEKCDECGCGNEWNGKPLALHLDHINGKNNDHRLENLRVLCPNCHTQTHTYAGKNISTGKNISDAKLVETFDVVGTLRGTCKALSMSPSANNCKRIRELVL